MYINRNFFNKFIYAQFAMYFISILRLSLFLTVTNSDT